MATTNINLEIKFRWWFRYLYIPIFITYLTIIRLLFDKDAMPDRDILSKWVKKGTVIKVVPGGKCATST